MALTLTIGTPAGAQGANNPPSFIEFVDFTSIVIQNSVQVAADTMEFTLLIYNNEIDSPEAGNEVVFKNVTLGITKIEFAGVLVEITRTLGPEPSIQILHCSCQDYVYYLNRRYVNKLYSSQAAGVTVKEILTDLFASSNSDVHYEFFKDNVTNVDNGDTLAAFTFDKIVPSQAFDMIAQSTGMQWWIDFDKKIYFKVVNSKQADFLLHNTIDVETKYLTHFDFEESESVDGVATQIILRDMTLQSTENQPDEWKVSQEDVDSGRKVWILSRTPFGFLGMINVSKNTGSGDVNQDLKYEDIDGVLTDGTGGSDDVFIYVKEPSGSYIRFADANTLALGNVIKANYKYAITDDLEDPDFTAVEEMKRRTGGDGIHQFIYTQTSGMRFVDLDDAEHVTSLLRERKSKILRRGSFKSWVNPLASGWQAGQAFIRLWSNVLRVEQMHIISVTKVVLTPDDSNPILSGFGLSLGTFLTNDPIIESTIVFSNIPYGVRF